MIVIYDTITGEIVIQDPSTTIKYKDILITQIQTNTSISDESHSLRDFYFALSGDKSTSIDFTDKSLLTATIQDKILLCVKDKVHKVTITARYKQKNDYWITFETSIGTIKIISGSLLGHKNGVVMHFVGSCYYLDKIDADYA